MYFALFPCAVLICGLCDRCGRTFFFDGHVFWCFDEGSRRSLRHLGGDRTTPFRVLFINCNLLYWFWFFFLAVVSLWFCKTLQKSYFLYFWFFFVCLMKTIHVNITSKKNVYFYDFWVITLLFANKIFNDNQLALQRVLFLWMKLTRSAQVLNAGVAFVSCADVWLVIVSAQLPSEPTSACGALMESDEVRASSCSLTDRAWIFAWLKKKKEKVSAPDGWLRRNLTAAKKHHAADPLVRSSGPRRLENTKREVKKENKHVEMEKSWVAFGQRFIWIFTAVTVVRVLVSVWEKQMLFVGSLQPNCNCCLDGLDWKSHRS